MCEQTEVRYVEKDIVWVKLGPCWWPGEVKDVENLPEDILSSFRKKPIAAVKFFQEEEKFEYVRNLDQICLYNCRRKHEFIQKGIDMYRAKRKEGSSNFMDKFPEDVFIAEEMTHGDKEVVARLMFTEEERFNYKNIFGDDSKPDKKNKDRKSKNWKSKSTAISTPAKKRMSAPASSLLPIISPVRRITHPRFLTPNAEYNTRIMEQTTSPPKKESETKLICPLCPFTAKRLNVIVFHIKYHKRSENKPESSAGNKSKTPGKSAPRGKTPSRRKKSLTGSERSTPTLTSPTGDKKSVGCDSDKEKHESEQNNPDKSETNPEAESKLSHVKSFSRKSAVNDKDVSEKMPAKKTILGKRKIGKSLQKEIKKKKKKSDDDIQDLLADWEDEVEALQDTEEKQMEPIKTDKESSSADKTNITSTDMPTEDISKSDVKINEPSSSDLNVSSKPVKKKTVSCFDFDDSADAILDDELEERAKKFVGNKKNPLIPSLEDKFDKQSNIVDNIALASTSRFSKSDGSNSEPGGEEIEDFNSEFQAIMAETAVPHLPEIPIASHVDSLRNTLTASSIDDDDDSQSTLSSLISKASKNHCSKVSRSLDSGSKFSFDDKNVSLTKSNVAKCHEFLPTKKEILPDDSVTNSASRNDDKEAVNLHTTIHPSSFNEEAQFDDSKDSFSDLEHRMEIVCGEISYPVSEDTTSTAFIQSSSQIDVKDISNDWETEDCVTKEDVSSMLMTPEERSVTDSQVIIPSEVCTQLTDPKNINNTYSLPQSCENSAEKAITVSESQPQTSRNDDVLYILSENMQNDSDVSISSSSLSDTIQHEKSETQKCSDTSKNSTDDVNFIVSEEIVSNNAGLSVDITGSENSYQNIKKDKLYQILTENSGGDSHISITNHASEEGLKEDVSTMANVSDEMQSSTAMMQSQNKVSNTVAEDFVPSISSAVSNSASITLPSIKVNTQSFSNDYIELKHDAKKESSTSSEVDMEESMKNEIILTNNKPVTSEENPKMIIENIQKDIITIPADNSQTHQSMPFVTEHIVIDNSAFLKDDDMEYDISSMPVLMTDAVIKDDTSGSFSTTLLPDYQAMSMSPIIISPSSTSPNTGKTVVSHRVLEMPSISSQSAVSSSTTATSLQPSIIQSPNLTPTALKKVKIRAPALPKPKTKTVVTPKGEKMLLLKTGQTIQYCGPATTQAKELKPATVVPQQVTPTSTSKIVIVSSSQANPTQQKLIVSSLAPHQVVSGGQRLISSAGQVLTQVSPGTIITKGSTKYIGQQPVRLLAPMNKPKLTMKSTPTKIILPNALQQDVSTSSTAGVKVLGRLNPQTKTFVIQGTAAPTSTVITKAVTSGLTMQSKLATLQNPVRYQSPKLKTGIQKIIVTNSVSRATVTPSQSTTPKFSIRTEGQKMTLQKITTPSKLPTSSMSVITNASQLGKRVTGVFPMSQAAQGVSKPQSIILSQSGKLPISSANAPKLLGNQPLTSKGTTFQTIRKIQTVSSQRIMQPPIKKMPFSKQKVIAQSPKLVTAPLKVAEIRPKPQNSTSGTIIQPVTSNVCTVAVSTVSNSTIGTAPQSVVSNQIAHVVAETPSEQLTDSSGATYVIVAIDDTVGLQQYNNSTLLAYDSGSQASSSTPRTLYIDPSALSTSGDLSNMILTIDDSGTASTGTVLNLGHTSQSAGSFTSETGSVSTTGSGQDILAVALANTDVFQPEVSLQDTLTVINTQHAIENSVITSHIADSPSSLNQTTMLMPSLSPVLTSRNPAGVLETSLTLNQPIMTPLEVPSCVSNLQIPPPTSLEIPLTITEPTVTASPSQAIKPSNVSLALSAEGSLFQPSMPVISDDMSDPSSVSGPYPLTSQTEPETVEITTETGDQTSKIEHLQDHSVPLYSQVPVSTSDVTNYISSIPDTSNVSSVTKVTDVLSDAGLVEPSSYMFDSSRTNGESEVKSEGFTACENESVHSVSADSVNIVVNSGDCVFGVTDSNSSYIPVSESSSDDNNKSVGSYSNAGEENSTTECTKSEYNFLADTTLNNSQSIEETSEIFQQTYLPQTHDITAPQPTTVDTITSATGVSMPVLVDESDINDGSKDKETVDTP